MPRRKKSVAGVLRGFRFSQPFVGFSTKYQTVPVNKQSGARTHSMNYGGTCREELIWDTREFLQSKSVSWKDKRGSWKRIATLQSEINVDHQSLKQPGVTHLWLNTDEDDYYGDALAQVCKRPCCIGRFPEVVDAVTGPIAVILNPDRYEGDWWTTSPKETVPANRGVNELRWYGTDNFFLRHPVLLSLMMGSFRQAVLLFQQGFDESLLRVVNRKEVEDCLSNADPELALKLLNKIKPWIAVSQSFSAHNFPFPNVYWHRVNQLYKAIHRYGYDELFGPGIAQSWGLTKGEDDADHNGRYNVANGPMAYFGTAGSKLTEAGKLLSKLGR